MKEHWVYKLGKTIEAIASQEEFRKDGRTGLYLWKFPKNLLFMNLKDGEDTGGIVMTEKTFKGIYEAMPQMEEDKVYRMTESGISKRNMLYDRFKKMLDRMALSPDVYIRKNNDKIILWIYDKDVQTLSLKISQMGEIYKEIGGMKNGKK